MNAIGSEARWMRTIQGILPVLALVVICLPVLGPLVQPGRMTCNHDGAMHLLRAFQLDTWVQRGFLWPRWLPDMVFGYGYPLFNFYPILSLYPVLILHHLGLSLLQGWNLSLALSVPASGLTMYLWARRVIGQKGALIAAVAFMLAPYQLYDAYWRGSSPESLAMPLLPLVLWAALRVAQEQRWRYAASGALILGALLLTHTTTSAMFTPVLLVYLAMLVWHAQQRRTVAFQLAAMMALGFGLAAFFLAPAYVERSQVQLWRAIQPGGLNFHYHFLSLIELFAPSQVSDPLLINPSPPHSLGWAVSVLALVGIIVTIWLRANLDRTHKDHVLWSGLTLVGITVLMSRISEPIWAHVPLLPFIQFPWRFLGIANLLAALLGGAGVAVFERVKPSAGPSYGLATMGFAVVMLFVSASPWTWPRLCPTGENPTQASYLAYEQGTGLIGMTSSGEYLPNAVQEFPTTSPSVAAMRDGRPIVRWDAPGARVLQARDDGLSAELVLESDAPVRVVYNAFYFAGWQAHLDGQSISINVVPPFGVMAMDVPAGHHRLTLYFGSTPLRTVSEVISLLVAIVVVAIWLFDVLFARRASHQAARSDPQTHSIVWLGLVVVGLALLAFKLGVLDRYDTPLRWKRLKDGQFTGAMYSSNIVVAGRARLLGYDVRPERIAAGDVFFTDLYWTLSEPLKLRATVRLLDKRGLEWSVKNEIDTALIGYPGPPPSQEWPLGTYADERHAIQVLPGTPPGDYWLVVLPFKPNSLEPLPISAGQPTPGSYPGAVLGKLQVTRAARPVTPESLELGVKTDVALGPDLTLVGYSQDREETAPGEGLLLTLGWQAHRRPQTDYVLRLELVAPDGQTFVDSSQGSAASQPPGGDGYPTSHWTTGEIIRTQIMVQIPGRTGSGQHTWRASLLDPGGTVVGQIMLGPLQIIAPQRVLSAPPMSHLLGTKLGDWVTLAGFDAPERAVLGQTISVALVWQAQNETDQGYKVFVHLLGADGQPAAQSDAVPAGWTRPTSGWQAGEYVTDIHTLDLKPKLPPGEYRLVVGMYTDNGPRLPVASGGDAVELGKIQVSANAP